MAKFKGSTLGCEICGTSFQVPPSRAKTARTCSHPCAVKLRAKSRMRRVTLNCKQCEAPFEVPRCHAERRVYCSKECMEASPAIRDLKAGRSSSKNAHWKGGFYQRRDGYIYESSPGHPFAGKNGHVLQHRLVVERHLRETEPTSPFLVEMDGQLYLSPKLCHVHHRDEDRANNALSNLEPMTPAEHRAHHRREIEKALAFYRKHHSPSQRGKIQ